MDSRVKQNPASDRSLAGVPVTLERILIEQPRLRQLNR
jgi:hypothetical protein